MHVKNIIFNKKKNFFTLHKKGIKKEKVCIFLFIFCKIFVAFRILDNAKKTDQLYMYENFVCLNFIDITKSATKYVKNLR